MIRIVAAEDNEKMTVPNQNEQENNLLPENIPLADSDPEDQIIESSDEEQEPIITPNSDIPKKEVDLDNQQKQEDSHQYKNIEDEMLLPAGAIPQEYTQYNPNENFQEITDQVSELDNLNQNLTIEQKIRKSLTDIIPLRIIYKTLKGHITERTVEPEYVHHAYTTGNQILVGMDHLRNDYRGFIISRILGAKLENQK